ncbi:TonB-dependent receptor family protein [Brevundimonas variabilis]|uniref:Iron complex outermembrane receptor protein n=1 Tax=Brevundimonas variabilis TaxID=74312 RepID=A0A7W9CIU6_9CAUL|nr:TonB-dependent receptor [Brevundimonas variabilis]MBB5746480.1 iron complex outermembrane receptor protein [Brevundimonas variabilis]
MSLKTTAAQGALLLVASIATPAFAQSAASAPAPVADLGEVIVTATPNPEDSPTVAEARRRLSRTPGSVAVVSAESLQSRYAPNIADVLRDVPGVYAQKKWGGDVRISIRGSGIGNANHLRGLFVSQDGIPFNEADGFGDVQMVDPLLARYTEVYKGGNALRFGGALLGGAVNLVTPNGSTIGDTASLRADFGSWKTGRLHAEIGGVRGDWDGFLGVTGTTAEGWRQNSDGQQQYVTANIGRSFGEDREARLIVQGAYIHQQIPGSLTLTQALNTPIMAAAANVANDYQRDYASVRTTLSTRWRLSSDLLFEGAVYGTWKDLHHPIFQVIDQQSRNYGAFGRLDWEGRLFGLRADAFGGAWYRVGDLDAQQFVNVRGSSGNRTARARQNAKALDVFGEGRLFVTDRVAIVAGGSWGRAERDFQSFVVPGVASTFNLTRDKDYDWFAPRVGLLWESESGAQAYANVTRSIEPPNFGSLSPTVGGFAPIEAQEAWTWEAGVRGRTSQFSWDVAVYRAELENELLNFVVNPALGIPAATFNAGPTVHQGIEAGLDWRFAPGWRLRQTYTLSDFFFENDRVYGDNDLPLVPPHLYRAELRYDHPSGWFIAPSVETTPSDSWLDYANTFKVPGYTVLNLGLGWTLNERTSLSVDARNLLDERYVSNFSAVTDARTASTAVFWPGEGVSAFVGLRFAY